MAKVIGQSKLGKYMILVLDEEITKNKYNSYEIDGVRYTPVPISDMQKTVAIEAVGDFVGKTINFV